MERLLDVLHANVGGRMGLGGPAEDDTWGNKSKLLAKMMGITPA